MIFFGCQWTRPVMQFKRTFCCIFIRVHKIKIFYWTINEFDSSCLLSWILMCYILHVTWNIKSNIDRHKNTLKIIVLFCFNGRREEIYQIFILYRHTDTNNWYNCINCSVSGVFKATHIEPMGLWKFKVEFNPFMLIFRWSLSLISCFRFSTQIFHKKLSD